MNSKYKLFHLAGYILLALIIYFSVDFKTVIDQLSKINTLAATILIFLATVDRFIMAIKWMHICSPLGIKTSYFEFLKIYYVASFLGYCLPTSLGSEVYKAARLSRSENSHDVLASMIIEKIVGVFSIVTFAWTGVLYITFSLASDNSTILLYILSAFTVAALFVTWLSLHSGFQEKITKLLFAFRIGQYIEKLTTAYSGYKNHKRIVYLNFIIAVFETALQLSIICGVCIAVGINITLPLLASIIAVTEFIRRVAIILDGWGFATALQIFMYSLVGITVEQALIIALMSHAVFLVASLPGGALILSDRWDKS